MVLCRCWDIGGLKQSIAKVRVRKHGKYARARRDREKLYIQGTFVNKDRIHRAAAFVGGRYCILGVFGVGIQGRMPRPLHLAEGSKAVPRHLIIDAFDPAACMSVSVPVTIEELSELFDHNEWIFAPGRKRELCRALLDRLCFAQSEEAAAFLRRHGKRVRRKLLTLSSPPPLTGPGAPEPRPLPPKSVTGSVLVVGNDLMFLSNMPRPPQVAERVTMRVFEREARAAEEAAVAAAEAARLAAHTRVALPRRRSSVTFVGGEGLAGEDLAKWLEAGGGRGRAAPPPRGDDFSHVAVLSKGSGTVVAAGGAGGVARRRLSVAGAGNVDVVSDPGGAGGAYRPSAVAHYLRGRMRAAARGGTRAAASDATPPGLLPGGRIPIGAHPLQPSDAEMRIVYRTARRLSGRMFLVTVSEDLTQPQNFHITAYDPLASQVYAQTLSIADVHGSLLLAEPAADDAGGSGTAPSNVGAGAVVPAAAAAAEDPTAGAWRKPTTPARRRRSASPLALAMAATRRAAAAADEARGEAGATTAAAAAPPAQRGRARATLALRHDTVSPPRRRRSIATPATPAVAAAAAAGDGAGAGGGSSLLDERRGARGRAKRSAATAASATRPPLAPTTAGGAVAALAGRQRSKSLAPVAGGPTAPSLLECTLLVESWRGTPVVECAVSVRRPVCHGVTLVLGAPNEISSGPLSLRRARGGTSPSAHPAPSHREMVVAFNRGQRASAFSALLIPQSAAAWPAPPLWSRAHRYEAARRIVCLLRHTGSALDLCGRTGLPERSAMVRACARLQ